jgi:hypothetical protein
VVNADGLQVLLVATVGLFLSIGAEQQLIPRPLALHKRACPSVALQAGIWLAISASLVLLLGRPWFALFVETALLLLIVFVNNAKVASLREPFVFQDFEYFTDAIRHPRLYLPFFGWGKAAAAAVGSAVAIFIGLTIEPVPNQRWDLMGQLGGVMLIGACAVLLMAASRLGKLTVTFDPKDDMVRLGLLSSLWCYAKAEWIRPTLSFPFSSVPDNTSAASVRPHLVSVQSESFFDPRGLFSGVHPDTLVEFDELKKSSLVHGRLKVPAWGANTVRSEFAFLSGVSAVSLGVHRFNPYRRMVAWGVPTLASYLKQMGYRTICVHPYPAGFYGRDKIYPMMGFDEFIDIHEFTSADRSGAYVGDMAVAKKIASILESVTEPVFIHAITMENHGPLHLEKSTPADIASLYTQPPPSGCNDLTIYLKHLRNADRMMSMLKDTMTKLNRPASLCWFGDHVPIMESVYDVLGLPDGQTEFLIWQTGHSTKSEVKNLDAHQLGANWLAGVGLMS